MDGARWGLPLGRRGRERVEEVLALVDAADPDFIGQQAAVQQVLEQLDAADTPRITVFNKIDRLGDARAGSPSPGSDRAAFVSAVHGQGLDALREQIAAMLRHQMVAVNAVVPYHRGELVARAKAAGDVTERYLAGGIRVSGHLPTAIAAEVTAAGGTRRRPTRR